MLEMAKILVPVFTVLLRDAAGHFAAMTHDSVLSIVLVASQG